MVTCQEPSPFKGSKHSQQCHPHDEALVNALSFVSMGVEARCCPCHNAAHCQHMKRQPSLCHYCHCCGRCNCDCRHHRRCRCRHHLRCQCSRRCRSLLPSPLLSPLAIAVAVAIAHHHRCLFHIAVSHCRRRRPPCRPLLSPSPLAIAVAIAIDHHCCRRPCPLLRVVALAWQELYSNNLSK